MSTGLKLALKPMYEWNTLPWKKFQKKVFKLQKRIYQAQNRGKCARCVLYFKEGEVFAIDHRIPTSKGGRESYDNMQLLHKHCHDQKTTQDRKGYV
jgi:RNA-directed DNA polymerase